MRSKKGWSEGKYARVAASRQRNRIRKWAANFPDEGVFIRGEAKPILITKFHMNNKPLYEESGRRIDWHWLSIAYLMEFTWRATEEEIEAYHTYYKGWMQYVKGTRPELLPWQLHEAFDTAQDEMVLERDKRVGFLLRFIEQN